MSEMVGSAIRRIAAMAAVSVAILSGCADEPSRAVTVFQTMTVRDSPPDVTVVETTEPVRGTHSMVQSLCGLGLVGRGPL